MAPLPVLLVLNSVTVANYGVVSSGGFEGIFIGSGVLANKAGGYVNGLRFGAYTLYGTIVNAGRIVGTEQAGAYLMVRMVSAARSTILPLEW